MKRFGNKKQIIGKHMDALLSIESVTSPQNVRALRKLYDHLETHIRGLRLLGVESESYGSLLASVLLKKLPSELQLLINRQLSSDDWTLQTLMGTLEEEIKARERTLASSHHYGRTPKNQPTSATLCTSGETQECCFCRGEHSPSSCSEVRSPASRKLALKRAGRCFICLRRGHVSTNCRSGLKCSHCNNRHHTSICLSHKPEPRPLQRESSNTGLNPDAAEYHRSRTAPAENPTTLLVENQGVILLQTAQAVVFNTAHPTMQMKIRVVLDTGSQKSYATIGVMTSLGLSPKSRRSMSIATFGSVGQNCQVCDLVTIGMEMEEGPPQSLDVFIVPTICEPLSNNGRSYVIEEFSHLQHLELSDPIDGSPKEIDVLVGSDYYWTLVTGRILQGPSGPTAVHTKLGWVLSGPTTLFDGCENPATLVTHTLAMSVSERLRAFWEIESLGVCETTPNGAEVEPCEEITFRDGQYEVLFRGRVLSLTCLTTTI